MIWAEDNEADDSSLLRPSPPETSVSRTRRAEQVVQRPQNSPVLISTPSSVSLEFSSSSSDLSTTTLSIVSQTSISASLLDFLDDEEEIRGEPPIGGPPRTVQVSGPERLVRLQGSDPANDLRKPASPQFLAPPRRLTPAPVSPVATSSRYPPRAELSASRSQARKASKRLRGYKEISRKLNLLSQDLNYRDDTRRQESKDVMHTITTLRDRLRDLHRIHEERMAIRISPVAAPRSWTSGSAGSSTGITGLEYIDSGNPDDLDYSYISSHHSGEFVTEEYS
ncbi:hypothetical protein F5887DRAFT_1074576 [Amanita rubescens]|nr:hypothetical protein F5887DRAFT_1225076 [Amanita rubescens]KAF8345205.1 hypothetical protein F5887DRAFT_1074576 [Amanita rubescens]